ncbi:MAG: hypothetical protein KIS66_04290 [Fimbriimonadaceae bacterium]|nr:hypothetical protein [Fimbriimonadaceae bacterium]
MDNPPNVPPVAVNASPAAPIADLTYRNYTGPLSPPAFRWWAIAKMTMRLGVKKKAFWAWAAFSAWFYVLQLGILTMLDQFSSGRNREFLDQFYRMVRWKDLFLDGYLSSLFFLFLCTLVLASGNIAADNKANALLVYLSKPATKLDYLLGKWTGFFLMLLAVSGAPMLLTYGYGLMTFREHGFLTQEPWLVARLLGLMVICPALLASVGVGVSAQFDQPRYATAAFAGLYFLPMVVSYVMLAVMRHGEGDALPVLQNLYYSHLAGLEEGLGKAILDTKGGFARALLGGPRNLAEGGGGDGIVGPPNGYVFIVAWAAVIAVSAFLAWRRVRAVEVVK